MEELALPFESDRTFQLWRATVGHSQLLLRSTQSDGTSTRVDVLFKPVSAMKIRTRFEGLSIRAAEPAEAEAIANESGEAPDGEHRVFVLSCGGTSGYVVAGVVAAVEDEGSYADPSALLAE